MKERKYRGKKKSLSTLAVNLMQNSFTQSKEKTLPVLPFEERMTISC